MKDIGYSQPILTIFIYILKAKKKNLYAKSQGNSFKIKRNKFTDKRTHGQTDIELDSKNHNTLWKEYQKIIKRKERNVFISFSGRTGLDTKKCEKDPRAEYLMLMEMHKKIINTH